MMCNTQKSWLLGTPNSDADWVSASSDVSMLNEKLHNRSWIASRVCKEGDESDVQMFGGRAFMNMALPVKVCGPLV